MTWSTVFGCLGAAALTLQLLAGCGEEEGGCIGAKPICGVSAEGEGAGFCTSVGATTCRVQCPGFLTPICQAGGVVCFNPDPKVQQVDPKYAPVCVPGGSQAAQAAAAKAFSDFKCPTPTVTSNPGAQSCPLAEEIWAKCGLVPTAPPFDVQTCAPKIIATTDHGGGRVDASGCGFQATYLCSGPYYDLTCKIEGDGGVPVPTPGFDAGAVVGCR